MSDTGSFFNVPANWSTSDDCFPLRLDAFQYAQYAPAMVSGSHRPGGQVARAQTSGCHNMKGRSNAR